MTNDDKRLQQINFLKEKFKNRLKNERDLLKSWTSEDHLAEFIHLTHTLAGSAGTFGYQKISQEMKLLEIHLLALQPNQVDQTELDRLYRKAIFLLSAEINE